ncbi:MAG: glycerophosphoryl diester phosphodiesterase membrane domain-containing protein, partial [Bacillota bacterium]|nr:glycerophosphoryl diester phosphodiesterase membrane domain-containing protein [Bacillota bacterium]
AKSADPNFKSTAAQGAISVMIGLFVCMIFILLFVAVIYLYNTLFIFSVNSIIMENESVIGSLKRSWQLIKRDFWKLYGCNILIVLSISAIRYSLSSVIAVLVSILLLILKLLNANQNLLVYFYMIYSQLSWPITIISYRVINPIGIIMTNLMYFNQRFKREGYDMIIELNKIQSNAKVIINERKQASGNIEFSNSNNSNKTTI